MARELEIDLRGFLEAIRAAPEAAAKAAKRGMHDALDEWKREAVDIAPLEFATLRRGISTGPVEGEGLALTGEITSTAIEVTKSGRRFNYAYYIHEHDAGGKSLRHPGTEKKFFDIPAERNGAKWLRDIENEIKDELKRKGW